MDKIEESIGQAATKIAKDVNANCIVSLEQKEKEEYTDTEHLEVKVTIFIKEYAKWLLTQLKKNF